MSSWLVKTEPEVYSIDDFATDGSTLWHGVRNYQARNYLKLMKRKEEVLIYYSNSDPTGIVGLAIVAEEACPDPTQFDKKSEFFDSKATKDAPRWFCPVLKFKRKFSSIITLEILRAEKKLAGMVLLQRGSRLSVQTVSEKEFQTIVSLM